MKQFSFKLILILLVSLVLSPKINAQEKIIKLRNPSFEDTPKLGVPPIHWDDCGRFDFPLETPPNVHPVPQQPFGVTQTAFDGRTYVGMVVRSNETWESFGQKLEYPLLADSCYTFSIYLASSDSFKSFLRGSNKTISFTDPLKLRIWGGSDSDKKSELLAESPLVEHTEWEEYTFYFSPMKDVKYIIFEAFFKTPALLPPNGNILLDAASDIKLINCETAKNNEELAKVKPRKVNQKKKSKDTFDGSKYDWTYHKETLERMKKYGESIKFRKNQLSFNNEKRLIAVANEMRKLPYHKLIIDFDGLKKKHARIRAKDVSRALNLSTIKSTSYEIRNSEVEDKEVDWLFGKDSFYIGIIKKN